MINWVRVLNAVQVVKEYKNCDSLPLMRRNGGILKQIIHVLCIKFWHSFYSFPLVASLIAKRIVFWLDSFIRTGSSACISAWVCVWRRISFMNRHDTHFGKHFTWNMSYIVCEMLVPSTSHLVNFKFENVDSSSLHFFISSCELVFVDKHLDVKSKDEFECIQNYLDLPLIISYLNTFPNLKFQLATLAFQSIRECDDDEGYFTLSTCTRIKLM